MREENKTGEKRSIRDIRQQEFADKFIEKGCFGILDLCPRFGKIRTAFNVIRQKGYSNILISYPDTKVERAWRKEFELLDYDDENVTYTTHLSLFKHEDKIFDFVIIDEVHTLSENQMIHCRNINKNMKYKNVLGLSGSIAPETEKDLWVDTSLQIIASYSMVQGIEEGIISEFDLTVFMFPLDNFKRQFSDKKGRMLTEKKRFDNITWVINNLDKQGHDSSFMRLRRAQYLQASPTKNDVTKKILDMFQDKRILVFTGSKKSCTSLGIPYHHSSSKNTDELFDRFAEGEGNHFAVIRIGNTGVTFKPLDTIIISYFTSNPEDLLQRMNRAMAIEYDNPDKRTNIIILCSNEKTEKDWLKKALYFVDSNKICYIEDSVEELKSIIK